RPRATAMIASSDLSRNRSTQRQAKGRTRSSQPWLSPSLCSRTTRKESTVHKLVLFLALVASGESNAANLVTNPDFDVGVAGWKFSGGCGNPAWDDVVGSPTTGALAINCVNAPSAETATQCIAVTATSVDFSLRTAGNGSAGPGDFVLRTFPSQDCSGMSNGAFEPSGVKSVPGTACCGNSW